AHNLQSHALPNFTLRLPIFDQGFGGPAQHVDEAGRHRQAGDVDLDLAASLREISNRGDGIAFDRDVGGDRGSTSPVVDGTVAEDGVVARAAACERPHQTDEPDRPTKHVGSSSECDLANIGDINDANSTDRLLDGVHHGSYHLRTGDETYSPRRLPERGNQLRQPVAG